MTLTPEEWVILRTWPVRNATMQIIKVSGGPSEDVLKWVQQQRKAAQRKEQREEKG